MINIRFNKYKDFMYYIHKIIPELCNVDSIIIDENLFLIGQIMVKI